MHICILEFCNFAPFVNLECDYNFGDILRQNEVQGQGIEFLSMGKSKFCCAHCSGRTLNAGMFDYGVFEILLKSH